MAMALAMRLLALAFALFVVSAAVPREYNHVHTQLYGFSQGEKFRDEASTLGGIAAVRLYHDWTVSGIEIRYEFKEWNSSILHGLPSNEFTEVEFAYPEEALVQIKGAYGPTFDGGDLGITKLSFHTYNYLLRKATTYGPFGGHYKKNQTQFASPKTNVKQITGFWGYTNSGNGLVSLSYFYEPSK